MATGTKPTLETISSLNHLIHQAINRHLPVPQIASLDVMLEFPRPPPARRVPQFKRPQEITRLFEIRSHREDLMDQVLHADDAEFAQVFFDDGVVRQWDPLLRALLRSDLAVPAFVDERAHRLQRRITVCDEWFDNLEHFQRRLGQADEGPGVDL